MFHPDARNRMSVLYTQTHLKKHTSDLFTHSLCSGPRCSLSCRPGGLQDQTLLECQEIALALRLECDYCVFVSVVYLSLTRNTTQSVLLIHGGSKKHSTPQWYCH